MLCRGWLQPHLYIQQQQQQQPHTRSKDEIHHVMLAHMLTHTGKLTICLARHFRSPIQHHIPTIASYLIIVHSAPTLIPNPTPCMAATECFFFNICRSEIVRTEQARSEEGGCSHKLSELRASITHIMHLSQRPQPPSPTLPPSNHLSTNHGCSLNHNRSHTTQCISTIHHYLPPHHVPFEQPFPLKPAGLIIST